MTDLLTMAPAVTLPRVNLLPPEIAEAARFRKVQLGLGLGVLSAVTLIGLGYVVLSSDVNSAQDQLATTQTTGVQTQSRINALADVPKMFEQVATAQTQLSMAMQDEVRWSYRLNELSLSIPPKVWLTNLSVTKAAPTPVVEGETPVASPVATVSFTGNAYSYNDVANWLVKISEIRDASGNAIYDNVYLSTAARAPIDKQDAVTFSSSADVTPDALSGRYTTPLSSNSAATSPSSSAATTSSSSAAKAGS